MKMLFQQYTDNRARICRLQRTDCSLADAVRGSRTSAPYTMHTVRIRGVDREMWNHVQERLRTLSEACRTAEEAAEAAPEPVRTALRAHYLQGKPWGVVGKEMGMHPDTIRKRTEKYLLLLEKQKK